MNRPNVKRHCDECGELFFARRKSADYCSPKCRLKAWRDRQVALKPKGNRALKAWHTKNKTVSLRYCQHEKCQRSFFVTGNNSLKLYCNQACRQAAYRVRKEAARRERQERRELPQVVNLPMPTINVPQPFLSIW